MIKTLSRRSAVAAVGLIGLVASCGDPETNLQPLTSPSFFTVEIGGPSSVAPGKSVQFNALVHTSDGTVKFPSPGTTVRWFTSNSSIVLVSSSGLVTARDKVGDATLTAEVVLSGALRRSTREVTILPDGTFRLVGTIREEGFPTSVVTGARIEASPGSVAATADTNGQYRLYGVPADAAIMVTADGYQPQMQNVHLSANATQNFQLSLSGPRLNLNGPYSVAIDVTGTCSGSPALPADLQHRKYDATLTQTGPTVEVRLTESRFRVNGSNRGDRFFGVATATGATFTLLPYSSYYYYYYGPSSYPSVAELLSGVSFLVSAGTVTTTGSAAGLSGQLNADGSLTRWDARFPTIGNFLGGCFSSSNIRLSLTPR